MKHFVDGGESFRHFDKTPDGRHGFAEKKDVLDLRKKGPDVLYLRDAAEERLQQDVADVYLVLLLALKHGYG